MASASGASRSCPKCGYVRTTVDDNPAWQCPGCGIAYHKFETYRQRIKASIAPRTSETGPAPPVADSSIWLLVGANGLVVGLALLGGWQLIDLMLVYWTQSLIIGGFSILRILSLQDFSTAGFKINKQSVEAVPATKRKVASFFAFHFGFFHVGYLIFMSTGSFGELRVGLDLLVGALAFGVNHLFSWRYHRDLDRQGKPNIGTLMFLPYVRIVPMHLTIIFGAMAPAGGILLFTVLKTGADVVMHQVEHRALAGKNPS